MHVIGPSPKIPACCSDRFGGFAEAKAAAEPCPPRVGVLVVDDDAAVRLLLDSALRRFGFTVWQAAHGQEAIEVYQQEGAAINLVLMDVRMPVLDGPQTLTALLRLNPQIRCCFMTGQAGSYSPEQLRQLGAAHIFQKPFQLVEIVQILKKVIGSPD